MSAFLLSDAGGRQESNRVRHGRPVVMMIYIQHIEIWLTGRKKSITLLSYIAVWHANSQQIVQVNLQKG